MRPVYDVNSYLGICPIFQEFVLVRMQDPCQNLVKVYTGSRRLFFDTRLPRQAPASYAYYQVQDDNSNNDNDYSDLDILPPHGSR